ncbi:peptidylprolyl isomerase [Pseudoalteromonas sp. SSM20]|uniref:peptidylprolyl isomerase n=1 Tax=Pseudoalteromonas sp. SSM20 TaxID=3139394 RepID=UPI003BADAD73
MIKLTQLALATGLMSLCAMPLIAKEQTLSPAAVIEKSSTNEWRSLDLENTLILTLNTGDVVIELNPELAPNHVINFKKLVREGFYNGLNIYRFVEGFVAQGGDISEKKQPKSATKTVNAEFIKETKQPIEIQLVDTKDGYADKTGFLNGFAIAQNATGTKTWQTHCIGNFAMARGNDINSGGTEFYVILGNHRYLDLNITSFGRVVSGIVHIQRLKRKPETTIEDVNFNPIKGFAVAADLANSPAHNLEVMKTQSASFKRYIESRRNRPEEWFQHQANYIDVCGLSVPMRNKTSEKH